MNTPPIENVISKDKHILLVLYEDKDINSETQDLINSFCGKVVTDLSDIHANPGDQRIYVCGDISRIKDEFGPIYIIKELSGNYENYNNNAHLITLGEVPIVVSNAGVYFRKLFTGNDYFNKIKAEHVFQEPEVKNIYSIQG